MHEDYQELELMNEIKLFCEIYDCLYFFEIRKKKKCKQIINDLNQELFILRSERYKRLANQLTSMYNIQ